MSALLNQIVFSPDEVTWVLIDLAIFFGSPFIEGRCFFINCMLKDIWQRDPSFHADIVSALNEKGFYGKLDSDSPLQIKPFIDVDMEGMDFDDFFKKDED